MLSIAYRGQILFLSMEVYVQIVHCLCWIDHVWSSKKCVCCACDPNECLSAPSICFVCVFVCRKLSSSFRAGSQVFVRLMLFLCVILHTMSLGKSNCFFLLGCTNFLKLCMAKYYNFSLFHSIQVCQKIIVLPVMYLLYKTLVCYIHF